MSERQSGVPSSEEQGPEIKGTEEQRSGGKKRKKLKKEIMEWALTFIIPVLVAVIIHNFVFTFSVVRQTSMLETLHENDWMAVSKIHYKLAEPQRGDIVVCNFPGEGTKLFVKRVIGVPGDVIEIREGAVYINGDPIEEGYISHPSDDAMAPLALQSDEYFLMGDNRYVSWDSRQEGPIKKEQIFGFVMGRVFPFNQMRWFYS